MHTKYRIYIGSIYFLFVISILNITDLNAKDLVITRLKNLYLNTDITGSGKSQVIIIVPENGIYDEQASLIQEAIREKSGITVPVIKKADKPEIILKNSNVIVLGNMTTNPFIYRLYCQWYTLLDQKYPGKGGYVVRSLHDPYGTGKNVIEIGGSDEAGVTMAAKRFCGVLPAGKKMVIGKLMDIKLGTGLIPPDVQPDGTGLGEVQTWMGQDWGSKNVDTGFGWNPISLAGMLYYMTGNEKYIECFKNLVKPDTNNIPAVIRGWYSFVNMKRPLVEQVEEYTDHQVDFVWDLIEESPYLSDEDRLYVTNELLAHQLFRDPGHSYVSMSPGRHTGFALLGIYSGSRYFAKYYPDPVWEQRLGNVRKSYNGFIGNPSMGNDNIFYWASFVQYIFEYFITEGYEDFAASGTAKTFMDALLLLRTGEKKGDYYDGITPYQINLAGYCLGDPKYFWLLNELEYDDKIFRVGRSFWPPEKSTTPPDIAGKFISFPLKASNLPENEGFEITSFRSGLDDKADYFQLDGHNGSGRSSYHLNSILKLRMSGGKYLLDGINNDIDITCNGLADSIVPQAAAMKRSIALDNIAFVRSEVPDMTNSSWQRNILYMNGMGLIVIDRTIARKTSDFEIDCSWTLPGDHRNISYNPDFIRSENGTVISFANQGKITPERGNVVRKQFSVRLLEGDYYDIGNLVYYSQSSPLIRMIKTGKNNFMVTGAPGDIFICLDEFRNSAIAVSSEFAAISSRQIFLSGLKEFDIKGISKLTSDVPVSLLWNLQENKLDIFADEPGVLTFENISDKYIISFTEGRSTYDKVESAASSGEKITGILIKLKSIKYNDPLKVTRVGEEKITWKPGWQLRAKGDLSFLDISASGQLWAAWDTDSAYTIGKVNDSGQIISETGGKGKILSFRTAKTSTQSGSFEVVAGFMDDTVRAFSSSGMPVWKFKAEPDPSFRIGEKYIAPWFSDPEEVSGVYDILAGDLWGSGREEIVAGRPVTLEFRSLQGELIKRLPTQWGTNTTLSLLKDPGGNDSLNVVLAGKFITGYPGQSAVNINHENVSDNLFNGAKRGWTFMNGWGQQGLSQTIIDDLDNDSVPEVITTITGHWNELRIWPGRLTGLQNYSSPSNKSGVTVMSGGTANFGSAVTNELPLWTKYFGPYIEGTWIIKGILQRDPVDKMKERFMKALLVTDLNGDGYKEVIVGLKNGWLHVFNHKGSLLWQKKFGTGIRCLEAVNGEKGSIAAGFSNGNICLMDGSGNILKTARLDSSIEKMISSGTGIYAGTSRGTLAKFNVK